MKRQRLKKLMCISGLLFITFPAWSAVPSNLLPASGNCTQLSASAGIDSTQFEAGMVLAKGGGGGAGAGGGGGAGAGGGGGAGAGGGAVAQEPEQAAAAVRAATVMGMAAKADTETAAVRTQACSHRIKIRPNPRPRLNRIPSYKARSKLIPIFKPKPKSRLKPKCNPRLKWTMQMAREMRA